MTAPIVLVPGFWLGAWAWDEVAAALRADGHDVTALTLPGLESADADRSVVTHGGTMSTRSCGRSGGGRSVVLAVHSGTGFSGYAASDRVPERIAAMVYVDSAPGIGAWILGSMASRCPFPRGGARGGGEPRRAQRGAARDLRQRAVPQPGGVLREGAELTNDARRDIPSTIICTGFPSEQVKAYAEEHNPAWLGGLAELRDVTWIDLPTSHWPMWSRPRELADDHRRRREGSPSLSGQS